MKKTIFFFCIGFVVFFCPGNIASAQSTTITPDGTESNLTATSTNNGVIVPQITLTANLASASPVTNPAEGLLIYNVGNNQAKGFYYWAGTAWQNLGTITPLTATAPISIVSNNVRLNSGTASGQLLTWNGNNWINTNPKPPTNLNIRQPYLALNFCIAAYGIFPSRDDAQAFTGEITIYAFNFAPNGWYSCNGQLISIAQNTALYALLGTAYGGNGQTNFGLPDLRGRVPNHQGQGPGLSSYVIGQMAGTETSIVDDKY